MCQFNRFFFVLLRKRWNAFRQKCQSNHPSSSCETSLADCRHAQMGIMGTILTTNCTCVMVMDESEKSECELAYRKLQHNKYCKGLYAMAYKGYKVLISGPRVRVLIVPSSLLSCFCSWVRCLNSLSFSLSLTLENRCLER